MIALDEVRYRLEEAEETLAPGAARSARSLGRLRGEEPSPLRTDYQRDRDRIVHSKAFRRLQYKTQVFIAPLGDHYITRLTHTVQVSQIARTIARALRLNEDLTEAIALGHDLGHTPFGHAGEAALAELLPGGFRHNFQSLRVVDHLEKEGEGLNLTWEVREGIIKHSKVREDILAEGWGVARTLEGQIVRIADSVAYINHDLEDARSAGALEEGDLPAAALAVLGWSHARRIDTLVRDIVAHSEVATRSTAGGVIAMSPPVLSAANELREFLFQRVYLAPATAQEADKAKGVVATLYSHLYAHPETLPLELAERGDDRERAVADQIAGMTDRYALQLFDAIAKPRLWQGIA